MDRREFFKKIIGGGGAALLVPSLPPLPQPVVADPIVYAPQVLRDLTAALYRLSFYAKRAGEGWKRYERAVTSQELKSGVILYDNLSECETVWEQGQSPCAFDEFIYVAPRRLPPITFPEEDGLRIIARTTEVLNKLSGISPGQRSPIPILDGVPEYRPKPPRMSVSLEAIEACYPKYQKPRPKRDYLKRDQPTFKGFIREWYQ